MIYKNKKTGQILETKCKIIGGCWEEFKPTKKAKKAATEESDVVAEESDDE